MRVKGTFLICIFHEDGKDLAVYELGQGSETMFSNLVNMDKLGRRACSHAV